METNKTHYLNKKVLQINPMTLIFKIWESMSLAANTLNINISAISQACNRIQIQSGGYYWRYYDEFINSNYIRCDRNNQCDIFNLLPIYGNLSSYINPCFQILPGEEFRDIKGYEGLYQVSNLGRVINIKNKPYIFEITINIDKYGYKTVHIWDINLISKHKKIHRLVAEAFIPNPLNLPCINHKNEIKIDNSVLNLEWCTIKYNNNYGSRIGSISKPVQQLNPITDEIINEFDSIYEALKYFNYPSCGVISSVCSGKQNTAFGFKWKYK